MSPHWLCGQRVSFDPEDGIWSVVHRHADPILTVEALPSLVQKQLTEQAYLPSPCLNRIVN
jgi:hypothetical protein